MEGIRQYILSVIAASIVCSVVKKITGSKYRPIIKVICGVFMAITILAPVVRFDFTSIDVNPHESFTDIQSVLLQSEVDADASLSSIIKEETKTYILSKAELLGLDINIDVTLDEDTHVPVKVMIYGDASPYQKSQLSHYIENTLAISEEYQEWVQ